jgi:hypothetical protein
MTVQFLLDAAQAMENEYIDESWFRENCVYREVFLNCKFFSFGIDTGHIYDLPDSGKMVVFRGTHSMADWISNFDADHVQPDELGAITQKADTGMFVHRGFQDGWKSCKAFIYDEIKDAGKVWFVGHSRGSAIATIAAQNCKFDFPSKWVGCLPFSSPRAGNKAFCLDYNSRVDFSIRIWYGSDPVVDVPLECQNYDHVQQGFHLKAPLWKVADWLIINPNCHYPWHILQEIPKQMYDLFPA